MAIEKVLVVDDDETMGLFIAETLRRHNIDAVVADNGKRAMAAIRDNTFDLVITDLKLPDTTGIEVLRKVKEISPSTIVIMITGYGSVETTVEAMKLGAFNYLLKPFSPDTIDAIIGKVNEHLALISQNDYLKAETTTKASQVIAASPSMGKILEDVLRIARSNASVFISGESGTGKEVIAQEIHAHSLRADKPFIRVNCAAIPETLLESEFFGHEKGAFTGAHSKKLGRFELANGGTLMLDEVTEVPIAVQAKLLRAIQEQVFERVGGTKSVKVDVRIIATSNRDMKLALENKVIREDLFYRLNVVPIHLPALRDRKEDIIPLSEYFLGKICRENHKEKMELGEASKRKLLGYSWPGNVRELANVIERAVVMSTGKEIDSDHVTVTLDTPKEFKIPVGLSLEELEKRLIIETVNHHQHDHSKAAKILGISPKTLLEKLRNYSL